jgi:branched-chain amino acid transport system ATP-binding protein
VTAPTSENAILAVRDLEKTFGSLVAAHGITISVPAQQTVGVIGANGAGKTTFINMITGHLKPSKGSIWFEDREITGKPSREITRLGISRSFQVAQIFPSLTVFENMAVAAAIACQSSGFFASVTTAVNSPAAMAEAEAAVELFQIARYRDAVASTLPQGVRKLLDIGMAVVGGPRLLLLDEPTSGIAIEEKFGLMDVIMSALKTRQITVLFVEHDMEIVGRFADRVLAFYDGTVIADGAPDETLGQARVQELITGVHLKRAAASAAGRHA